MKPFQLTCRCPVLGPGWYSACCCSSEPSAASSPGPSGRPSATSQSASARSWLGRESESVNLAGTWSETSRSWHWSPASLVFEAQLLLDERCSPSPEVSWVDRCSVLGWPLVVEVRSDVRPRISCTSVPQALGILGRTPENEWGYRYESNSPFHLHSDTMGCGGSSPVVSLASVRTQVRQSHRPENLPWLDPTTWHHLRLKVNSSCLWRSEVRGSIVVPFHQVTVGLGNPYARQ